MPMRSPSRTSASVWPAAPSGHTPSPGRARRPRRRARAPRRRGRATIISDSNSRCSLRRGGQPVRELVEYRPQKLGLSEISDLQQALGMAGARQRRGHPMLPARTDNTARTPNRSPRPVAGEQGAGLELLHVPAAIQEACVGSSLGRQQRRPAGTMAVACNKACCDPRALVGAGTSNRRRDVERECDRGRARAFEQILRRTGLRLYSRSPVGSGGRGG